MKLVEQAQEPWTFEVTNVKNMLNEATEIIWMASPGSDGVSRLELMVAINNLKHAADELERSYLEMRFGVRR